MKSTPVKIAFGFLLLILFFTSSNIKWGKDRWKGILVSDAHGYFAYLPAVFIYHDLNFRFIEPIEEKYGKEINTSEFDFRQAVEGGYTNKFYCGTALAQVPFFLTAHVLSGFTNYDLDGYSRLYMIFVNVAAIFYLAMGLFFQLKLLERLNLTPIQQILILFATVFGSSIFIYTVLEPGMSHIYSYAFITSFLYFSWQYFATLKGKYIILVAICLGMITLIRPVNVLIVLLFPFIAGCLPMLKNGFLKLVKNWPLTLVAAIIFFAIAGLQFVIYKINTGNFLVYSYGKEGFNFLQPHFLNILFSYKKGLFVYTPLFFVSLLGGYYLWKLNRFYFIGIAFFLLVLTYVLSSWWCWWYGGSFSSRPYMEFTALFMLLLALALQNIRHKVLYRMFVSLVICLILVCQFQTYQYRKGQIHWENMTKEKYWDVFLRVEKVLN